MSDPPSWLKRSYLLCECGHARRYHIGSKQPHPLTSPCMQMGCSCAKFREDAHLKKSDD